MTSERSSFALSEETFEVEEEGSKRANKPF